MADNRWDATTYDRSFGFVTRYGDELVETLDPVPGERILDLGCGTGHHAAVMAARGAAVVGMDLDPTMLAKAAHDHPEVSFVRAHAARFSLSDLGAGEPFDACLSNAALHWMQPQERVLANVRAVLATGARFVAEMGGARNIATLDSVLRRALAESGLPDVEVPGNYFPTVGVQGTALEAAGFRVERMHWFRRPTPLEGGSTPADWTRQFRASVWDRVPADLHGPLGDRIDALAADTGLRGAHGWVADYCRLRFVAVAV